MPNVGVQRIGDNQSFLKFIFGPFWGDAHVCSFTGDPGTAGGLWLGGFAVHQQAAIEARDANNYFCVSVFTGHRRVKEGFKYQRVLVFDDVLDPEFPGDISDTTAKVLMSRVRDLFPGTPSYVLETSPFNFQVGFVLHPTITDRDRAEMFINGFIAQGLCAAGDPGQSGVTRYVRLPLGRTLTARPDGTLNAPGRAGKGVQTRLVSVA